MSLFVATPQEVEPLPQQTVKVELDPLTFSLKVFPESLEVVPGSQILWEFSSLPEGFVPWLRFESDGQTPLGPFPGISQLSSTLVGQVPLSGAEGSFPYRLLVRSRTGTTKEQGHATVWSSEQSLVVTSAAAKQPNRAPVKVTPESGNVLKVEPQTVLLLSASDALLAFEFSPEILDHATGRLEPRIEFLRYTPPGGRERTSPPLGPFSALIFSGNKVWGSGDAGLRGLYNYQATALRQSTGEVVWASSTDPVIDDQREPPP